MKKRGQFYLVAGILIIFIIVGLISVVNYAQKSKAIVVDNIKKELKIETQKVLEYEINHPAETAMKTYGVDYSSHIGSEIELYFIMGSEPNVEGYQYINGEETVLTELTDPKKPTIQGEKIIFTLEDVDYEFDLMSSENFYYLILQEIKGEYFVATG